MSRNKRAVTTTTEFEASVQRNPRNWTNLDNYISWCWSFPGITRTCKCWKKCWRLSSGKFLLYYGCNLSLLPFLPPSSPPSLSLIGSLTQYSTFHSPYESCYVLLDVVYPTAPWIPCVHPTAPMSLFRSALVKSLLQIWITHLGFLLQEEL